jgi:phosphate transport system permease protein
MMMEMNQQLYRKRRLTSLLGLTFSMTAMLVGLAVLIWILFVLFSNGLSALDGNLLTSDTPAPGTEGGGLRNAIVGLSLIHI